MFCDVTQTISQYSRRKQSSHADGSARATRSKVDAIGRFSGHLRQHVDHGDTITSSERNADRLRRCQLNSQCTAIEATADLNLPANLTW